MTTGGGGGGGGGAGATVEGVVPGGGCRRGCGRLEPVSRRCPAARRPKPSRGPAPRSPVGEPVGRGRPHRACRGRGSGNRRADWPSRGIAAIARSIRLPHRPAGLPRPGRPRPTAGRAAAATLPWAEAAQVAVDEPTSLTGRVRELVRAARAVYHGSPAEDGSPNSGPPARRAAAARGARTVDDGRRMLVEALIGTPDVPCPPRAIAVEYAFGRPAVDLPGLSAG